MCSNLTPDQIIVKKTKKQKTFYPDELLTSCVPEISFSLLMLKKVRENPLRVETSFPLCTIERDQKYFCASKASGDLVEENYAVV